MPAIVTGSSAARIGLVGSSYEGRFAQTTNGGWSDMRCLLERMEVRAAAATKSGRRSQWGCSSSVHRLLKQLAFDDETNMQALLGAALDKYLKEQGIAVEPELLETGHRRRGRPPRQIGET